MYGSPPWGDVQTPNLDAFASEALVFDRVYPEVLPTLPARRALYTGQRVYPFIGGDFRLKGDHVYAPGWGPIHETQSTLAELLRGHAGYRTGLISDLYHMFKPSKNFTRGFDQWTFLRGQELDPYQSGPEPSQPEIDYWLSKELQGTRGHGVNFIRQALKNMHGRSSEGDHFNARVIQKASEWLEQNREADQFFLIIECFDPHEPWFVPEAYRKIYDDTDGAEQVLSIYGPTVGLAPALLRRAQANYSGLVTMCDRSFGRLYRTVQELGLLEDTLLIVASDHGHSIGDGDYMGKVGYPSRPEVFDVILMIRHPKGQGAGRRSELLLQHTDLAAQILDFAGISGPEPLHGQPFWRASVENGAPLRDHVTIGWGSAVTVIDQRWWLNCKVDRSGPILQDLHAERPFQTNLADDFPDTIARLFNLAVKDAGGGFPEFLLRQARGEVEIEEWNPLAPSW